MTNLKNQLTQVLQRCQNQEAKDCFRSCILGYYTNNQNIDVPIKDQVEECILNTQSFPPEYQFELPPLTHKEKGLIEIRNESTLRGGLRLVVEEGKKNVCALNFANASHPGGGVNYHANAQEETLCRSSALYCSLIQKRDFYEYHIEKDTNLASNYLIFSPDCPTWKADNYEKLNQPFLLSYITSAAVHNYDVQSREEIKEIHDERIKVILTCAICNGVKNLILGAFGCGAFKNNPNDVAQSFKHWLVDENYKDYFESISFSIIERKDNRIDKRVRNIDVFAETFNLPIIETEKYIQKNDKPKDHKKDKKHPKEDKKAKNKRKQVHKESIKNTYSYSDSNYTSYDDYSDYSDYINDREHRNFGDFDLYYRYRSYWDYYYYYYHYYWNNYYY